MSKISDLVNSITGRSDLSADELAELAQEITRVADERMQAEVPGYWSTSDEHGNIDGQYATREQALEEGPGQYPFYVEIEEDDEEAMAEWCKLRAAEVAEPWVSRSAW